MKFAFAFFIALFTFNTFSETRQELHEKAKKEFYNLHFFENGRGMTISPDLPKFLSLLTKSPANSHPNLMTPNQNIKGSLYKKIFQDRYGFNMIDNKILGVFEVPYKGMKIGVLGCTACHSGKAAGHIYPGLGNKTIDPYQVGADAKIIQTLWGKIPGRSKDFKQIHNASMKFVTTTANKKYANLTKGLVSDAVIKTFFYDDAGIPYDELARAQVKVPHLWGFVEKRKTGVFWGGEHDGSQTGWEFGAELFASHSPDHFRASLKKLEYVVQNVFGNFLPPTYPFHVDQKRASLGQILYKKNCYQCHGDHQRDAEGYPIYDRPKLVSHRKVQTDFDRLIIDEGLNEAYEASSVSDILKVKNYRDKGYIAPKLWGIWSRFPYLHNGSVPTLYHLMIEPAKRPEVFSMHDAGEAYRYDQTYGGLTLFNSSEQPNMLKKAKSGNRSLYYTKRIGHSSQGHYFDFMKSMTNEERMAVIEYLKTL